MQATGLEPRRAVASGEVQEPKTRPIALLRMGLVGELPIDHRARGRADGRTPGEQPLRAPLKMLAMGLGGV